MNPLELAQNQMDFIEESVKKTFRIPVIDEDRISETEAENLAEDTARDEEEPKEPCELTDKELQEAYASDHDCDAPNGGGCSICLEMMERGFLPNYIPKDEND